MVIQYVFVKVVGASASVDQKMTDAIYDAGGTATRGYYRCIDSGSIAGEKLDRDDLKTIIDEERKIWEADPINRSTLLYWDSVFNRICINLLGWASKNVTAVAIPQTPTSKYIEGIVLRQCILWYSSGAKPALAYDKWGTLTNSAGEIIYLYEYGPNSKSTMNGVLINESVARVQPSLMINTHAPVNNDGDAHELYANDDKRQSAIIWKNGDKLSGISSLSFDLRFLKTYANNAVTFTLSEYESNNIYSSILRPTKTVFSPSVGVIDSLYTGVTESSSNSSPYYAAGESLCLDGGNTFDLYLPQNSPIKVPTKIDGATAYVANTGQDDIFGLISGGKSVNASFWIPTLQGASATSSGGSTARFSTIAYNATGQGKKGLGGFIISGGNPVLGEEFTTDDKHSVCIIIKKTDGSFRYSWSTAPLTLKFLYSLYSSGQYGAKSGSPMFADIRLSSTPSDNDRYNMLSLDVSNVCDDFRLDYSGVGTVGSETGSGSVRAIRYKSGTGYFTGNTSYGRAAVAAKLGRAANVPHINSTSVDAVTPTLGKVLYGATYDGDAQITAVYPTSG